MDGMEAAVKRHLKITWTADETESEVSDIMDRAAYMLNDLVGEHLTYEDGYLTGRDRDLYLNLCLYLYNGLTEDEFISAYGKSLTIARQFHAYPVDTEGYE